MRFFDEADSLGYSCRPLSRGELLKLRWSDVDFGLNTINFKQTKSNKDRSVPMEPIVKTALLELRDTTGDAEYVFVNPDTGTAVYRCHEILFRSVPRSKYHRFQISRSAPYVRHSFS